ncbi:hypothetical protein ACFFF2_08440, partial [Scopulibacillus daqui]|uniref:hypothetical protein n=1 Tax=Scopulibacillus daqui TaxID=1469162 RepID=UPI0035EA1713
LKVALSITLGFCLVFKEQSLFLSLCRLTATFSLYQVANVLSTTFLLSFAFVLLLLKRRY